MNPTDFIDYLIDYLIDCLLVVTNMFRDTNNPLYLILIIIIVLLILLLQILKKITSSWWSGDSPVNNQINFQDPASNVMEGLWIFNTHLIFVILGIIILISWLILLILDNFTEKRNSNVANFTHESVIEVIWTMMPAIILLSLASPSFSLLYSMDEVSRPDLTLKIIGHQWYWTYEVSDFNFCINNQYEMKYQSYILPPETIKEYYFFGTFRLIETNKRVVLPTNTHIRFAPSNESPHACWRHTS